MSLQFWSAWKLLGATLMWHRILSDSVINDLAVRSLLNLYLLPALNLATEVSPADGLDKVAAHNLITFVQQKCKFNCA